ncbi:hypothetical protein WJX72_004060 [[Myrmecia] bisecta]|uniref:Uncharacterized protein n=1 Tax=[Myrmecia] bisecta TaxID=41462 RepID=A0AAW1Q1I8_9CHLO
MSSALEDPGTVNTLLFDLEAEESSESASQAGASAALDKQRLAALYRQLAACQPSTLWEIRLLRDVKRFREAVLEEDGRQDSVVLASKLHNVGYSVALRTAVGGGSGQDCFHHLHHEFLVVGSEGELAGQDLIVDPSFRDQFVISQSTPLYRQLLERVPAVFVGTAHALVPLVRLLCSEMACAFEANGQACPPWRQPKSMISKWLPARARDITLGRGSLPSSPSPSGALADTFSLLVESGLSPTGPLSPYASPPGAACLPGVPLQGQELAQPFSTKGFRLKSLLTTKLAAPSVREQLAEDMKQVMGTWQQPRLQSGGSGKITAVHAVGEGPWGQPAIRTVKMAGARAVRAC